MRSKAIKELLKLNIKSVNELFAAKRKISKKYGISILLNSEIIKELRKAKFLSLRRREDWEKILKKRAIRTLSGIAPIAVLTKPFFCPGECAYCPKEKNVPQSYLSNEPAVMRAIRCGYHPYVQVQDRLRALENNGHKPTKIELIVIGGTWSALPNNYKYWYIKECFRGANEFRLKAAFGAGFQKSKFSEKSKVKFLKNELFKQQKKNEGARYRIIGLTLETRPDYINEKEVWQMRELGCTRVEIGVQAIDDKILKLNKRGHGVAETAAATKLLKNYGFKVTYHIMPGLPGSNVKKDLKMFKQLFNDEKFQPDQIKFYPTVVVKGSLLYRWWRQGKYKPYSDQALQNLIIRCKMVVPRYVRIIRLIRDIPSESIEAGNMITNLRQIMKDRGVKCNCIRCREARKRPIINPRLNIIHYQASGGEEYFISYESADGNTLYGFCRLRLFPCDSKDIKHNKLNQAALIRELHVYGELVPIGNNKKVQHAGLGKKLMQEAERIAQKNGFKKIAVISGIGARDYYRKLSYRLQNTYMVKMIR